MNRFNASLASANVSHIDSSRGAATPAIILGLVAALVVVFALLVMEKSHNYIANADEEMHEANEANGLAANNGETFEWRMVTSWPKNFPGIGMGPENFAELVNEMSGGRLVIHVYGGGEIVPALGVFDAVSTGAVEVGHTGGYYHIGKIPASPFFTAVPFGMNAQEINAWLHHGGGLELWRELYEPFNLIPFAGGNTGVQMGGWFNKEINSLEDIRGLKMRIPGIAGEVFQRAGGTAVTIAGGELYTSMQTGVIDATEWVGPYNDRSFGFNEVGQYYYYPGWHETGSNLEFDINLDAWNRLPEDLQAIVEAAARAVNQDMLDEYTAQNAIVLQELIEDGVDIRPFPDEVIAELKSIAMDFYAEEAEKDETFAHVYQEYWAFFEKLQVWHAISEVPLYLNRDN
ncbi:MAG: TRAP transporter substrate-binding protein DctP [Porticoccaceae bacterium]|jgi:TRAP-type mannitol/chloroaromatic compound transport system substrate-binding protein|nr:TRAP transporter substrate-binding protein DctP [Porticoccaceae bacterium]